MEIKLQKWGNSQGIRIPKTLLNQLGITEKATFKIEVSENKIILTKKQESKLSQLFEGFDYESYWEEWNKQHPGESKEIDWGDSVGKEIKW